MNSTKEQALLHYLKASGPTRSSELIAHFGISRPTLSRWLNALGDQVVSIGKGRAIRFAALHRDLKDPIPLYRVSQNGRTEVVGDLSALEGGGWLLESDASIPALFGDEFRNGLFPGWPWFLDDLRPSGFLGRAFARRMAALFNFETNPERWNDLQTASALAAFGENLQGNFIIGRRALDAFHSHKLETADGYYANSTPPTYPLSARQALDEGERFGSSAGGEQPKFTTLVCDRPDATPRAVIVKFSHPTSGEAGRRWADLLRAEHIANRTLSAEGFKTASTRIFHYEDRVFLESERFDRIGATGRRGLVTLRALDAAFSGQGSGTWDDCARRLFALGKISAEDRDTVRRLHAFGTLIGNTDMHFGNLSFFLEDTLPYRLAPVYDMLPMYFRPGINGEIHQRNFEPKYPRPEFEAAWLEMWPIAAKYWTALSETPEISDGFRDLARNAFTALQSLRSVVTGEPPEN